MQTIRKLGPRERCLVIIPTHGEVTYESLTAVPDADKLHDAVGGFLEVVPMFRVVGETPAVAFCNEEGKLLNLPVNHLANVLWMASLGGVLPNDVLVGPIAIVTGDHEFLGGL